MGEKYKKNKTLLIGIYLVCIIIILLMSLTVYFAVDVLAKNRLELFLENYGIIMLLLFAVLLILFITGIAATYFIHKRDEASLWNMAYIDQLTKLPNLNLFNIEAQKIIDKYPETKFIILKFDIHQFKIVNEMYGYQAGDALIKAISTASQCVINSDKSIIARIHADTFIALSEFEPIEEIENIRQLIIKKTYGYVLGIVNYKLNIKIGYHLISKEECLLKDIVEKTYIAHQQAKEQTNIHIFEYNKRFRDQLIHEAKMLLTLDTALKNKEFVPYLQAKYNLKSNKVVGAEILVRWQHKDKLIMPGDFIPFFEKSGYITKLDMYMLKEACQIIRNWTDNHLPIIPISINFSPDNLTNIHLASDINKVVQSYGIAPKYIEIELTESAFLENTHLSLKILSELHQLGYVISMDDFGSGYSSLGLLQKLPVDILKIDKSFFTDLDHSSKAMDIIEIIIQITKKLNLITIAEGVETKESVDFLKRIGCEIIQGYYFAKPVPVNDFMIKEDIMTN